MSGWQWMLMGVAAVYLPSMIALAWFLRPGQIRPVDTATSRGGAGGTGHNRTEWTE